jgi:hypothetical protein
MGRDRRSSRPSFSCSQTAEPARLARDDRGSRDYRRERGPADTCTAALVPTQRSLQSTLLLALGARDQDLSGVAGRVRAAHVECSPTRSAGSFCRCHLGNASMPTASVRVTRHHQLVAADYRGWLIYGTAVAASGARVVLNGRIAWVETASMPRKFPNPSGFRGDPRASLQPESVNTDDLEAHSLLCSSAVAASLCRSRYCWRRRGQVTELMLSLKTRC